MSRTIETARTADGTSGMGDSFLRLSAAEIAERDAARSGTPTARQPVLRCP